MVMRYADCPTTELDIYIAAPPERIWPLISDIRFVADTSPELRTVTWQDEADGPCVGARFTGRNFHQAVGEWETTSIIIECAEPTVFAWAVTDVDTPSAVWRFTVRPEGDGSVLTQWAQMGPGPCNLTFAIRKFPDKEERIVDRRLAEFRAGMTANLNRIKELSERDA